MKKVRFGKIARLPEAIREELNQRLRDGGMAPELVPWLNAFPAVQKVVAQYFDGKPVTQQNVSIWRLGGYAEWEQHRDRNSQRVERTRELAKLAADLARAGGGNLADGAASLLGGTILEVFEGVEDLKELLAQARAEISSASAGERPPRSKRKIGRGKLTALDSKRVTELVGAVSGAISGLTLSVARLRRGDQGREVIRLNEARLRQKEEELQLAREKFRRATAEAVLKSAKDPAVKTIAAAPLDFTAQLEAVGQHLFGDLWTPRE